MLKGGLYLYAQYGEKARPTRDLDLLGRATPADVETIASIMCEIAVLDIADGVRFDPDSLQTRRIKEDADYEGVRVRLTAHLERARQLIQIDVGFGDVVVPAPKELDYPTFLDDLAAPTLLAYSMETVIAEKFQAMVVLGAINSRAKDFYDIYQASRTQTFEAATLSKTLQATFERRGTALARALEIFAAGFADEPFIRTAWAAFRRTNAMLEAPEALGDVVAMIRTFLEPVIKGTASGVWLPEQATWT